MISFNDYIDSRFAEMSDTQKRTFLWEGLGPDAYAAMFPYVATRRIHEQEHDKKVLEAAMSGDATALGNLLLDMFEAYVEYVMEQDYVDYIAAEKSDNYFYE